MPAPRSRASNSRPTPSRSSNVSARTSPPPPCFSRLVASSVTTIATCARRGSGTPCSRAKSPTSLRASATWLPSAIAVIMSFPTCQRHDGALARRGRDVELVDQPFGAAQPETQALAAGIAVGHRQFHVGDAGALVGEGQPHAVALAVAQGFHTHVAPPAVIDGFACDLAGGGDDFGLVDQAESGRHGTCPDRLPHPDHV